MSARPRLQSATAGRLSAALAAVVLVLSYGLITGGAALLWSDRVDKYGGYVWSTEIPLVTSGYAVTSDAIHLDTGGVQAVVDMVVQSVRLEVVPTDPTDVLFVGVARSADVADYLGGVAHRQVGDFGQGGVAWGWLGSGVTTERRGGPPTVAPGDIDIWLTQSSGVGPRTVTWPLADGDWVIVVMRADGGAGVDVTTRTGAAAPDLQWIAGGMIVVGLGLLVAAGHRFRRVIARLRERPRDPTAIGDGPTPPAASAGDRLSVGAGR